MRPRDDHGLASPLQRTVRRSAVAVAAPAEHLAGVGAGAGVPIADADLGDGWEVVDGSGGRSTGDWRDAELTPGAVAPALDGAVRKKSARRAAVRRGARGRPRRHRASRRRSPRAADTGASLLRGPDGAGAPRSTAAPPLRRSAQARSASAGASAKVVAPATASTRTARGSGPCQHATRPSSKRAQPPGPSTTPAKGPEARIHFPELDASVRVARPVAITGVEPLPHLRSKVGG